MEKRTITFKGNPLTVRGEALKVGGTLPQFRVSHFTGSEMKEFTNKDFAGRPLVFISVPSIDTPVCSTEVRRFSKELESMPGNAQVLVVSLDLPFAQVRWCGAEGVKNVLLASDYKYRSVSESFGLYLEEMGLLARAVFVTDASGTLRYVEYVPEVAQEPNYDDVLKAVRQLNG